MAKISGVKNQILTAPGEPLPKMPVIKGANLGTAKTAKIQGQQANTGGIKKPLQNLQARVLPPLFSDLKPKGDYGMLAETGVITAAQAAAFLSLRIPFPDFPDNNQFTRRFEDPNSYQPDKPDGHSKLGTPIYGRIILGKNGESNDYTDAQDKPGSYQTVELDCAICTVDYANKVVLTDIQGLPQTIKEFISSGDDDVTINGIYNSTPGVAPMDFIMNLKRILKAPVPIPVTNYFLNALDIYYIVIVPGSCLPQEKGGYAYQTFTIRAISDTPATEMLP